MRDFFKNNFDLWASMTSLGREIIAVHVLGCIVNVSLL